MINKKIIQAISIVFLYNLNIYIFPNIIKPKEVPLILVKPHISTWQSLDHSSVLKPYFTSSFLEEMEQWNMSNWSIFEWNMGETSSLWLGLRCKKLISVIGINSGKSESFYKNNNPYINVIYKMRPISRCLNILEDGGKNQEYTNAINETNEKYDCIILNGYHRTECTKQALKHIKTNGIIILNNCEQRSLRLSSRNILKQLYRYPYFSFKEEKHKDWKTDYWIIK